MGLAYIGKVIEVIPIEGADRIESLKVVCGSGGLWRGSAQKGQFAIGDLCEVYLQDTLLPQEERFAFMEKHKWRVRMMRFKGTPSEVLIMPPLEHTFKDIGLDITGLRGVTKYEKPMPANMSGDTLGWFPTFIPKTDEPNFQSVPAMVQWLRGKPFYSTVKADGSSATVYKHQGHFGCCSRNLELKDTPGNAVWQIAREYELADAIPDGIAIQFEVAGPGIQGNPLGLKKVEPRLFNVYDIEGHRYLGIDALTIWKDTLPMVDLIERNRPFDFGSDEDLRKYAEGLYPNGKPREGVVIRPMEEARMDTGERVSFKVINLLYKE